MKVPINQIKANPKNPRILKDDKFLKLKKSLEDFPEMLEKRPLIVFTDKDGKFVVLGGNMRLKVANELGIKELPIILADDWTEEQKAQFLIKDNISYGDWDWDILLNEWDTELLDGWGLENFAFSNELDYSILDSLDDDENNIDSLVKDKENSTIKSVLVPFNNPDELQEFIEIMKKMQTENIDIGNYILELLKENYQS